MSEIINHKKFHFWEKNTAQYFQVLLYTLFMPCRSVGSADDVWKAVLSKIKVTYSMWHETSELLNQLTSFIEKEANGKKI